MKCSWFPRLTSHRKVGINETPKDRWINASRMKSAEGTVIARRHRLWSVINRNASIPCRSCPIHVQKRNSRITLRKIARDARWCASPKLRYRFMLRIILGFPRGWSPRGNNLSSVWCHDIIAIFDTLFEVSMLRAVFTASLPGTFASQSLRSTRLIKTYSKYYSCTELFPGYDKTPTSYAKLSTIPSSWFICHPHCFPDVHVYNRVHVAGAIPAGASLNSRELIFCAPRNPEESFHRVASKHFAT